MREFLLLVAKPLGIGLAACALMVFATLLARGEGGLIGALLLGYFTGAIYVWTLVYRTWRSAGLSAGGAKKQMLWGLVLRLSALFAVLFAAIHISVQVFSMTAFGFLLFYVLFMVFMAKASRNRNGSGDS